MTRPSRSKIFRSHKLERPITSPTNVTYKCVTTVDPTNPKAIKQSCKKINQESRVTK